MVFNVNLINYGANLKPDICVYYETQRTNADTNAEDVERAFNRFAEACFTKTRGYMIYFCYFLIGFLIFRLLIAFVNYLSFAYLPKVTPLAN